jgi:hypothetical protein
MIVHKFAISHVTQTTAQIRFSLCNAAFFVRHSYAVGIKWPIITRTHFSGSSTVYAVKRYIIRKISKRYYFRPYSYLGRFFSWFILILFLALKKMNDDTHSTCPSIEGSYFSMARLFIITPKLEVIVHSYIIFRIQFFNVFFLIEDLFCVWNVTCARPVTHTALYVISKNKNLFFKNKIK